MDPAAQTALTPEFVFAYRELVLSTIAAESRATRKVIAAVPEAARRYKHDEKSKTAHELAWHLAESEVKFLDSIADMSFTMGAPPSAPATIGEILAWYDENFPRALKRVRDMTPEQLLTPVDFFGVITEPVFKYLLLVNNHSVHHRGQLATYLRPMGSKVPSIYGGSADEPFQP
jgi:uncharacterized damage-inducible protein DinB